MLFGLVLIASLQGDQAKANGYCYELLAFARETGTPLALPNALFALGMVASISGKPGRAVRLLAAIEAWGHQTGVKLELFSGPVLMAFNHFLETAWAQLGSVAFETAWAEGQQMTLEQALALATEEEGEDSTHPKMDFNRGSSNLR